MDICFYIESPGGVEMIILVLICIAVETVVMVWNSGLVVSHDVDQQILHKIPRRNFVLQQQATAIV